MDKSQKCYLTSLDSLLYSVFGPRVYSLLASSGMPLRCSLYFVLTLENVLAVSYIVKQTHDPTVPCTGVYIRNESICP